MPLYFAHAVPYIWDGGGDNVSWNDPFNWDLNIGFPDDNTDTATINIVANVSMNVGAGVTIGELTVDTANAVLTFNGNMTVDDAGPLWGDVIIGSAAANTGTVILNGNNLSLDGDMLILAGGTLDASAAGSDITSQEDWRNFGSFLCGTNTVTFSGNDDPQRVRSGGDNFYDITVNKTVKTDTLQFTANLTQAVGGALSFTGGEIDLNGNIWTLGAAINVTADTQFTVGAGTLDGITNNVNITFNGGDISVAGGGRIRNNDFTVTDNGVAPDTALTMTGTGGVDAIGNMLIQAPVSLVDGSLRTSGTFTVDDALVTNGSVRGTGTGGVRVVGAANPSTINGDVTLANGNFDVDGNLAVGATYTLQITGNGSFIVDGTTNNSGTIQTGNGASTFTGNVDSSGTINIGGTGLVTLSGTYGAVTSTGTVAMLSTGNVLFVGNSTFTGGTLTGNPVGGQDPTIEFQGNVVFGTFTHNSDVVQFSGASSPQTFDSNAQVLSTTNIVKTAGANFVRLTSALNTTGGALTITTGRLDFNGFTLTAGDITIGAAGTLDASGAGENITVQGDWSNGGIFLCGNNTITFNGGVIQNVDAGGFGLGKLFRNIVANGAGTTFRLIGSDC